MLMGDTSIAIFLVVTLICVRTTITRSQGNDKSMSSLVGEDGIICVDTHELESEMKDLDDAKTLKQARLLFRPLVREKLKLAKKVDVLIKRHQDKIENLTKEYQKETSVLTKEYQKETSVLTKEHQNKIENLTKEHQNKIENLTKENQNLTSELATSKRDIQSLSNTISLLPLRNRIEDIETRHGVGTLELGELEKYLKDINYDVNELLTNLREFSDNHTRVYDKKRSALIDKLNCTNRKQVKQITNAVAGKDPRMSNTVAEKATVHALRFRYIFMRYSNDSDVQAMIQEVDTYFDGDIEKFCREVGYLFIKLSTVGVHLMAPILVGKPITMSSMKLGLIAQGINDNSSLNVVNVLYSTTLIKVED